MRASQEQLVSSLCHLFNAIPVWGLMFSGAVWFRLREESRSVVRHARQAMLFHGMLLATMFVWCLVGYLARVIAVLSASLGNTLSVINDAVTLVLYLVYLVICLLGFMRCLNGQSFDYPLVGGGS